MIDSRRRAGKIYEQMLLERKSLSVTAAIERLVELTKQA